MQHGEARSPLRRTPNCCCASRAGDEAKAMQLDLESGRGHGEVTRTWMSKFDDMTDAEREVVLQSIAERAVSRVVTTAARVLKCIVRGVLILLWVCMIDFIRRITSIGDGILVVMILSYVIPVAFTISICFCCANEMLEAYVPTRAHVDFE